MPSTLKSIIATVFYLCSIIATVFYLCTVVTTVKTHSDRMQLLNEGYRNLRDNIAYHESHITGPYTKTLLDQMLAVKIQVSDMVFDLGCREQKKHDDICYFLMLEEKRLVIEILNRKLEWYVDAEKEVERKAHSG